MPKHKIVKWVLICGAAVFIAATGFLREFIFVNVNEQLRFLHYENEVSHMSEKLSFLSSWSFMSLYYLKWALTITFASVFLTVSCLFLKLTFNQYYLKELGFLYALLFVISGMLFIGYSLFDMAEDGYLLSRYFMGIAQSPIPLMLIIPATQLRKRLNSIR